MDTILARGGGKADTLYVWSSVRASDLADLRDICRLIAIGLSLTALLCSLGYAESIGPALGMTG